MMPTDNPPEESLPPAIVAEPVAPAPLPPPVYHWYDKVSAVLFITFCLDLGLFLLIFPWTEYWDNFAAYAQNWGPYVDTMYVRGAITGMGVVNLYISLGEVFRLRRFSSH